MGIAAQFYNSVTLLVRDAQLFSETIVRKSPAKSQGGRVAQNRRR
jgi:hypothetical protein